MSGERAIKLIDFGFSSNLNEIKGDKKGVKFICGTPNYMSPELLGRKKLDNLESDILKACDVWALGVSFFTMFVGYFPFKGM
jgi:serine/threonine protein kinase